MTGATQFRLGDLAAGPLSLHLVPDEAARAALALRLGLEGLPKLEARLEVRPWLDGCEVRGGFQGEVIQVCGVSLEPFSQPVAGVIDLRLVPEGSPNLPVEISDGEVEISLDSPDPPDVLEGDAVDVVAILEEHLALAIDPFPRRSDAVFDWTAGPDTTSPFAALNALKERRP
ncbi:MAG: DUF177 domain-containing protein [Phenylobacterium sp.]|uniref:YceD family protein n=1 Tax=Phenylobacterium sp. TaxID=1871053 RepID=UPI003015F01D